MRTEDGQIIQKCLNGDPAAFGLLVDKYKESIYALAYSKLGNFHDAEDVAQEVFIKAYEKLRTLKQYDSFLAWLYSITSNFCRMWIRARSRRPDHDFIEDQDPTALETSSMDSYRAELMSESVSEALDSLPEMHRQVLTLFYLGGMSGKEIARLLGTSPNTIRQRLFRARAQFKKEMLAMMSATFERGKLPGGFTLRIVEAVRRLRIHPVPRTAGLPWGLSLATGIIIAVLGLGSRLNLTNPIDIPARSSLSSKTHLMEAGEIPVGLLRASQTPVMAGNQSYGDAGSSMPGYEQNAIFMAPRGQEDGFPEKPTAQLGKGSVKQIAYSPDGKLLAAAGGPGIWMYDADSLDEIKLLEGHEYGVLSVAFSPDGELIVSGGKDGAVRLWDVARQKELKELGRLTFMVYSVAFSPDGELVAAEDQTGAVGIYSIQEEKQIALLEGLGASVKTRTIAFSPDGKLLASGGKGNAVRLWNVAERRQTGLLKGHTNWVYSVAFSPDGETLATAGLDMTIRLWDAEGQRQIAALQQTDTVISLAFSPNGEFLASGSWDKAIRFWDVAGQKQLAAMQGHLDGVYSLSFSPDGKTLASSSNCEVRIWDVEGRKQVKAIEGHTGFIWDGAFSPDGKLFAAGGSDRLIRIWDVEEQRQAGLLQGHSNTIWCVAFSPDGKTLASGSQDKTIRLWDVERQRQAGTLLGHSQPVNTVAFSPDGELLASGGEENTIRLWDVQTRRQVGSLQGHKNWVYSVAFSPDGRSLASGSEDKTIRLWDVQTRRQVDTLQGHTTWVGTLAFSPDGKLLASSSGDKTIRLWDVQTRKPLETLLGHTAALLTIAFSPDGRFLASGACDMTVRVWDVEKREQVALMTRRTGGPQAVGFSSDGKWLAAAHEDGTVQLWKVNLDIPGESVEPAEKQLVTWGKVKQTELFQNFPNPFNPETWIPYQLSEDSDVAISIYNASGQLVRRLNLGQRSAGTYLKREKAAYWDGRNDAGEPVASDVYFYAMEAGESSTDVRKMVMVR